MLICCWSVKGGSGTSVVAASLAAILASRDATGSLFVDLDGDGPALFGEAEDCHQSGVDLGQCIFVELTDN